MKQLFAYEATFNFMISFKLYDKKDMTKLSKNHIIQRNNMDFMCLEV